MSTQSFFSPHLRFAALGLVLTAAAVSVLAQAPADALFSGFKPSGDFLFELGGKEVRDAEIYLSERAGAYLILGPSLSSPLLVNTRTQRIESVSLLKVQRNANKTIDLLADAAFEEIGQFQVVGQKLTFKVKGQDGVLRQRPPLLGMNDAAGMVRHNPSYGFKAEEYQPDPAVVAALKGQSRDVRVRVYFGSWCPVCGRMVPKVIKTASQLEGSKIRFEYYGLPQPMTDDPVTNRENLNGVPTAIVYVDGKEKGRMDGNGLTNPEKGLQSLLAGGG